MTLARVIVMLMAATLIGGCTLFGRERSTAEPPAELQPIEQTLDMRRLWSTRVGRGAEGLRLGLGPSTDGVNVYVGAHDGRVSALDAQTGRPVWTVNTRLPLSAGPGYGAGLLAFGTTNGQLVLLDAETGEELWRVFVGSEVLAAPAVSANVVVLRSSDGRLRGFSVASGAQTWAVEHSQPALIVRGDTRPKIAGQVVVAGFDNGRIGVYRLASGDPVWELPIGAPAGRTELDRLVDVAGELQVLGNDVYAVGYQARILAADLNTGLVLWTQEASSLAGLGVDQSRVYITTDASHVLALSRTNGTQQWTQEALRLRDLTAPTRFENAIAVGDFEGFVHWLDVADGRFVARQRASSARITEAPILVGRNLVVQTDDGRVVAFALPEEEEN